MDCKQAQRLFDELARNRLGEPLASQVRDHVADCTDCRVQHQRAARLQQLLAVKRYERPSDEYRDGFLAEFHRRQMADARRGGLWGQLSGWLHDNLRVAPGLMWRYGLASAVGVVVAGTVLWFGVRPAYRQPSSVARHEIVLPQPVQVVDLTAPSTQAVPVVAAAQVPPPLLEATPIRLGPPANLQPATISGLVIVPAAATAEPTKPRYVLDRLQITPASYDASHTDF